MIEGSDLTPAEFRAMNLRLSDTPPVEQVRQEPPIERPHPHHRLVRLTPARLRAMQVQDRIAREGQEMGRAGARADVRR